MTGGAKVPLVLAKSHSERSKEDRFAKIIRTMLITI
jgi:hypothetical protein